MPSQDRPARGDNPGNAAFPSCRHLGALMIQHPGKVFARSAPSHSRMNHFFRLAQATIFCAVGVLLCARGSSVFAQRDRWNDDSFDYRRTVEIPAAAEHPTVIVADFFAHGQLRPGGENLIVYGHNEVVPTRVLQEGPGDYCRIAFKTLANVPKYHIYYGGDKSPSVKRPAWTLKNGLLLETHAWQDCNLNSLPSIRDAFTRSNRIGSDFVERVFHRHNPFDISQRPFLSRYVGMMQVPVTGKYTFYTSSQDASFLLINDKVVVSAPGKHPPERRAKLSGEIQLEEGLCKFEYYHAASGNETCMVAAWTIPGFEKEPAQISPAIFRSDKVMHLPARGLEHRGLGPMPDFRMAILGDIPSPQENEPAMVRVQFVNTSPRSETLNAKYQWDLGDGQSTDVENPGHVYLHPSFYVVKLTVRRGAKMRTATNRVQVIRSIVVEKEKNPDKLASYIELLEKYNALKLDPYGLVQLVRAYLRVEQWDKAVRAGKMAFSNEATLHDDNSRWELIKLLGPLMRNKLDDAQGAADTNRAAASLMEKRDWRVACAIEAADTYLNDLLQPAEAKPLLEFASGQSQSLPSLLVSRLYRVWGDFHCRAGDGQLGKASYAKAKSARRLSLSTIKQITQRGAHSRSAEAFLRQGELERLRDELNQWQSDFPMDKTEGFLSVLLAGYWIVQDKFPQAIAVANDLLTVRPNSPFADRLLYLAALCEGKLKHKDRAVAAFQSLLEDYPGSPFVDRVREQLARVKAGSDFIYDDLYPPRAAKTDKGEK